MTKLTPVEELSLRLHPDWRAADDVLDDIGARIQAKRAEQEEVKSRLFDLFDADERSDERKDLVHRLANIKKRIAKRRESAAEYSHVSGIAERASAATTAEIYRTLAASGASHRAIDVTGDRRAEKYASEAREEAEK